MISDFDHGSTIVDATQRIGEAIDTVLNLINDADVCSVLVLIGILFFIGQKLVVSHPSLQAWGNRLATAAFIAYCIYGCTSFGPTGAYDLLLIALRGLLAAGLMLGISWIALPIVTFLYRHTIGAFLRAIRDRLGAFRRYLANRRIRRQEEKRTKRGQKEYERSAPERERQRQEAEARARVEAEAQRRREDTRAACELFYGLYAPDIGERFPKVAFDDFVTRYLSDNRSPQYVEQRAQQLQHIIQQHLEKVEPPKKKTTLAELAQWFLQEKQHIEASPLNDEDKALLVAQLEGRYTQLQEKYIRGIQP